MSPELDRAEMRAAEKAAERAHERARMLASDAIDEPLATADATWLAEHLSGCADCRSVADEYRALHDELRGLATPEPPRDLWARTSTAIDAVDRSRTGLAGLARLRLGGFARSRSSLGSAMAVTATVLVVGLSLLSQGPLFVPGSAPSSTPNIAVASAVPSNGPQAALAVVDGNSYWVAPENGVYQIKGGAAQCKGSPESCAITNGNGTVMGSITSKSPVSVVIAPNATRAAVWNANKIVILPLAQSAPATVAIDLLTPRPTTLPAATPAGTSDLTQPPASVEPGASPSATEQPAETAAPVTSAPTAAPTATAAQPTAILDGYKIVGRAPEFSANGLWVAFSARPVNLNSGSDVFVWRVGWERAQMVTASHADLFAGWLGPRILISEFAASDSGANATPSPSAPATDATEAPATAAPVARAATVAAISYLYDPLTAGVRRIDRPMLMPVVDPTGRYVVYWSGTVEFDPAIGLWGPGQGDFYFDAWSNLRLIAAQLGDGGGQTPSPEPTAVASETPSAVAQPSDSPSPLAASDLSVSGRVASAQHGQPWSRPESSTGLPQRVPVSSTPGTVTSWSVRWDATGQYVAIWVAAAGATDVGHVTLLNVIPGTNMLNVNGLLLSTSARSNIQFDDSQFVYTSPAQGGEAKTYLFQLPAVPPAPSVTPEVPAPSASPESGGPVATDRPLPVSTDRPGS
jgi:hypothetical protein